MDPIAERILHFLQEKGISKSAFAEAAGINKASLSHIESGRNKVSLNIIESFSKLYPDVDLNWLIQGGEKETISTVNENKIHEKLEEQVAVKSNIKDKEIQDMKPPPAEKTQLKLDDNTQPSDNDIVVLFGDGTYKSFRPK